MRNPARLLRLAAAAVCLMILTACVAPQQATSVPPAPAGSEEPIQPPPQRPAPLEKAEMPEIPLDELQPPYVFGRPLAAGEAAEDAAFANCAFIGDSRTEGLQLFGGLKQGDYLWYRGPVVYAGADPEEKVFRVGQEQLSLPEALSRKEYDAVYIMSGVNEMGNSAARFESALRKFIELVEEAQPEAVIYLQTILPVNDAVARKSGMRYFVTNRNVDTFNEIIVRMAEEKQVVLLDTAEVYRDESGQLPAEMTKDGCHFKSAYYPRWADYLRTHVMDPGRYRDSRAAAAEKETV